jgi:exonuclease V gamma subunit
MKKQFTKILNLANELSVVKDFNTTEEDLDILAEAIDTLNNTYEKLYDKVFVKL